jgi:hypothetical protein
MTTLVTAAILFWSDVWSCGPEAYGETFSGAVRSPGMTRSRTILSLIAAALLVPAAAVAATPSGLDVHAIFAGGHGGDRHAGAPLFVSYHHGYVHSTKVCWTPAPVDRPACSTSKFGVPARAGTQKLTLTLSNGKTLSASLKVGAAATKVPGNSGGPAQPMQVTCATTLYGNGFDGHLRDRFGVIAADSHVAAYYRVPKHQHIVQVWDDASNKAGFIHDSCLKDVTALTAGA